MAYLLARVENFSRFQGEFLSAVPIMQHAKTGKSPHEMYNFFTASDGFIYGYLPRDGGGNLKRLGGAKNATEVSDITVIFISSGVLCGYYRNATVFEETFRHPDLLSAGGSEIYCRVRVRPEDAFLVPKAKRTNHIQPIPKGQHPVLYGDKKTEWVEWFEQEVLGGKVPGVSEKKRKKWSKRIERSSNARDLALRAYGLKCECCEISHEDSVRASVFEVHHKVPFAVNFATRDLDVSDLAMLCANCHRMIHKMPDVSDIESVRAYLRQNT